MGEYLRPRQVGFGTNLGCEAAIHATRAFINSSKNTSRVILKIDYKNAFNSVERDILLNAIKVKAPSIYPYIWQCYSNPSFLYYGENQILSLVGAQQGDPLGPLVFSLAIHPMINEITTELNVWYLDDGTLGDDPEITLQNFKVLIQKSKEIGLDINSDKCELYFCSETKDQEIISKFEEVAPNIKVVDSLELNLLGSPILEEGFEHCSEEIFSKLSTMFERLPKLNAHTGFALLKNCFGIPKLTYILRTNPTWKFPNFISNIDNKLKLSLETILNVNLNNDQWAQSSFPVKLGGLGIRKVEDLALPSFLSSAYGCKSLVSQILSNVSADEIVIDHLRDAISAWNMSNPNVIPNVTNFQRNWDSINLKRLAEIHLKSDSIEENSRLLACKSPESGYWLNAIPSKNVGTFLNNNQLRIAVALRLGCNICQQHKCTCGGQVYSNGRHGLSCKNSKGTFPKHADMNAIIAKGFGSINVPTRLEPTGLNRDDGKRPDGMTLIPWMKGRVLVWDSTCADTFANSYLKRTSTKAGEAAEIAVKRKKNLYKKIISQDYNFVVPAVETMGTWSSEAKLLFNRIGKMMEEVHGDIRLGNYFKQRISIAIQKGNAASVMGTIPEYLNMEEIFLL